MAALLSRLDPQLLPDQRNEVLQHSGGKDRVVLTNPPFGKKSSIAIVNEEGDRSRQVRGAKSHCSRQLLLSA